MPKSKAVVATTDREIDSALAQARKFAASDRRVVRVAYERKPDLLTLYLDDGVRVSIPRMSLQGLRDAKPAQLSKVEILGRGTGLHWPLLRRRPLRAWPAESHLWHQPVDGGTGPPRRSGHQRCQSFGRARQWQEGWPSQRAGRIRAT